MIGCPVFWPLCLSSHKVQRKQQTAERPVKEAGPDPSDALCTVFSAVHECVLLVVWLLLMTGQFIVVKLNQKIFITRLLGLIFFFSLPRLKYSLNNFIDHSVASDTYRHQTSILTLSWRMKKRAV